MEQYEHLILAKSAAIPCCNYSGCCGASPRSRLDPAAVVAATSKSFLPRIELSYYRTTIQARALIRAGSTYHGPSYVSILKVPGE